jgi:3-methyl-2-oxobutanoate hydroxymethyltransferase
MLRVMTLEEVEAAAAGGVELLSIPFALLLPALRDVAPDCFIIPGGDFGDFVTTEDYLRAGFRAIAAGADAIYCPASLQTIRRLRDEGIPVCGHVGLIPSRSTWTGGFRAVGKTAATAYEVYRQTKLLEEAGAFAAEIEVVPEPVASAIARRTSLFMISMGSGSGCDAQYLFAEDVLGSHDRHYPRHAKKYRDFREVAERLQHERTTAFAEFVEDVRSGAYPERHHLVDIDERELADFLAMFERESPSHPEHLPETFRDSSASRQSSAIRTCRSEPDSCSG